MEDLQQAQIVSPEDQDIISQIEDCNSNLHKLVEKKTRGAALRAKTQYYEQGERGTKFFHSIETRNYNNKTIFKLQTKNGEIIDDQQQIIEEEQKYYRSLYDSRLSKDKWQEYEDIWDEFYPKKQLEPESTDIVNDMERDLNEQEVLASINESSPNKSPGSDGLPVEFYKTFWPSIKNELMNCYRCNFMKESLSITQRQGIITLIPKADKDPLSLANWRPISLLNADYKILTKCLANRLKVLLPNVIHPDQTGFMAGRIIGENILKLECLKRIIKDTNQGGTLYALDFEKAFDSLEWPTIQKALDHIGVGINFKRWVKCLHNRPTSCVINGGHYSNFFELKRGVRQGCPISPYLFIITIEALADKIRNDKNISGVSFEAYEQKISLYADDISLVLMDDKTSLNKCLEIIDRFGTISGLRLNTKKTEQLDLGNKINIQESSNTKPVKILGIMVHHDSQVMENANVQPRIENIQKAITVWQKRNISFLGRIYVTKSMLMSQIIHILSVLPTLCEENIKILNSLLFKYIWKGGTERIKREILIGPYDMGGVKAPDIRTVMDSLHLKWLQNILAQESILRSWVLSKTPITDLDYLLKCNLAVRDAHVVYGKLDQTIWYDVFKAWCRYHYKREILTKEDILHESIFYNSHIRLAKKPFLNVPLCRSGIKYIGDLLQRDQRHFLTWEEIRNKSGVKINFLDYYRILQCIPKEWRKTIRDDLEISNSISMEEPLRIQGKLHKEIYEDLILKKATVPHDRFDKWQKDLGMAPTQLDVFDWVESYPTCFTHTVSVKLRSFEYQLRLRDIMTNEKLTQMRIKTCTDCRFCVGVTETIVHLFWDCPQARKIWVKLKNWIHELTGYKLHMKPSYILLNMDIVRD